MGKIRVSINLSKLNKEKFFTSKNGDTFASVEVVERRNGIDQYGNSHFVVEALTKDEWSLPKDQQPEPNYVGNGKEIIFGNEMQKQASTPNATPIANDFEDDGLPF